MHQLALRCRNALRTIDWRAHLATLALLVIAVVAVSAWPTVVDEDGAIARRLHLWLAGHGH